MKVSIARGTLLNALSIVSRGLSSRTTLPILSGIHIASAEDSIVLQATDLEVSIKTTAVARVEEPGQIVVPGRLLTDIIRSLPEAAVSIDTTKQGSAAVTCGQSSFSMRTLTAEDYPRFPEITLGETVALPAELFAQMVHQVSRAVSRDETRPILTGVLVVIEDGALKMAATDSYRLCVKEVKVEGVNGALQLVVPGKALEDVAKLASSGDMISLGAVENQVVFLFNDTTFISRRIEGTFPNYKQLLPKEHLTRVLVDRNDLFEAVKRVSLMARHNTPVRVRLSVADHTLTLSANTQDVGEASEDIQVAPEGEDVEIAFNHGYLLDGVSISEGDTVAIEVTSPLKPGVLKPAASEGLVYLLMPVRLG